jgi:DNA-binding SARP family transcriptional activator
MVERFSRSLLLLLLGGIVAVAAAVAFVASKRHGLTPPLGNADPRLSYSGPYLNVHPDVKYVGDKACADCHQKQAKSYHEHPMGRSLHTAAVLDQRALMQGHNNPFHALGSEFRIERDGERVTQREVRRDAARKLVYETLFTIDYVVGSGSRGYSYLTDRGGYVFQTPMSWYSSKQIWDLAPGWETVGGGRAILPGCLFCHANRVEPVAGRVNQYMEPLFGAQPAIGCERCHGPGERHVATGGQEHTIVNPAKLEPRLRDAVCQQCHLEGEHRMLRRGRGLFDFRPGMPLGEFWNIFVDADLNNANAVNHVEQMELSRCFKESGGKLGCVSCHDPHAKPTESERVGFFRGRCLTCHEQHGCSLAQPERRDQSRDDSCIECHMPRKATADIAHTASTDHRIPRRPSPSQNKPHADGLPIRSFFRSPADPLTRDDERDLGIALAELASRQKISDRFAKDALSRLDAAVAADPADLEAREARAAALLTMGRRREAGEAFAELLALAPERESAVASAAELAMTQGRNDEAIRLWRKAIALNPWRSHYHGNLARLLAAAEDWPGARESAAACLKLDPARTEVRVALVEALLHAGEIDSAKAEFARIEALNPPDLDALRRRFAPRLR